jgi:GNAT superfamily N-acetyltransferase
VDGRGVTTVRRIDPGDQTALADYVRIRNAVTPDNTDSLEQIRWETAIYPGEVVRFLADGPDGEPVGTTSTGRIWMHEAGFERYWLGIWVLPEARRQGVGSALYAAVSDAARAAGKTGFQTELSEEHADGRKFLENRGFVETDRSKMVRLDLAGLATPDAQPPAGIRFVTLAERPDLLPGVHATAVETFPDIPWTDEPISALDFDAFVARDVDRTGIPRDAFFVAVDGASGEVAGYASLIYSAGSTTVAYHDMTAVRRAYRGRGIAGALKRATITWAVEQGLESLETGNDEQNAPMRAVNLALGYQPIPDWIGLQGPLTPPR